MVSVRKLSKGNESICKYVMILTFIFGLGALHLSSKSNKDIYPSSTGVQAVRPQFSSPVDQEESDARYALANKESLGFFHDIDERRWKRLKDRFQSMRPNEYPTSNKDYKTIAQDPKHFWMENFIPEFSCESERKLGALGDGGKWICDPHRIKKNDCLVYSIGSFGVIGFEKEIISKLGCEVHTFDMDDGHRTEDGTFVSYTQKVKDVGATFHHNMLGSPTEEHKNGKRFKDIFSDLKHEGKTIDIMKIDCEGCEWEQYLEWFQDWKDAKVTVRQLLIELHCSPPKTPDFFHKLWDQGYVIFHTEANNRFSKNMEFALIKLHPDFQAKQTQFSLFGTDK